MLRVIIADDHDLIRDGFRKLLDPEEDFVVAGEARSACELDRLLKETRPDIVVLDISLPDKNGLEVLKELSAGTRSGKPRVLVFSMHPETRYARRVLAAGAAGYMTKDTAASELVEALRRIARGGRYVSQALAEELAAEVGRPADTPPHTLLSDREYELLLLIGKGLSVRDISAHLTLSVNTVNSYRSRLMEKMGLHTNAEIIRYTILHGLVD